MSVGPIRRWRPADVRFRQGPDIGSPQMPGLGGPTKNFRLAIEACSCRMRRGLRKKTPRRKKRLEVLLRQAGFAPRSALLMRRSGKPDLCAPLPTLREAPRLTPRMARHIVGAWKAKCSKGIST